MLRCAQHEGDREMFWCWPACISKAMWLSCSELLTAAAFTEDDTETLIVLLALIFAQLCGPVQLGVSWMRFKMLFCMWKYCSGDRQLGQQGYSTSEKTPTLRHTKSLYPAVVTLCFCHPLTELGAALLLVWLWGIFIVQWAEFVQLGEGLSRYLLCTGEPVGCFSGSGRMKVEDSYIQP